LTLKGLKLEKIKKAAIHYKCKITRIIIAFPDTKYSIDAYFWSLKLCIMAL
jgi:hypothetical protein